MKYLKSNFKLTLEESLSWYAQFRSWRIWQRRIGSLSPPNTLPVCDVLTSNSWSACGSRWCLRLPRHQRIEKWNAGGYKEQDRYCQFTLASYCSCNTIEVLRSVQILHFIFRRFDHPEEVFAHTILLYPALDLYCRSTPHPMCTYDIG